MINILCQPLPSSIIVEGKEYKILTDFRDWILFQDMLSDKTISQEDRLLFTHMWFPEEKPPVTAEMVKQLVSFFTVDADRNDRVKKHTDKYSRRSFSFAYDSEYIFADFLHYYNINLIHADYIHWWEFRSLLKGLPEDSQTVRRIAYRTVKLSEISDKKERKRIGKIQAEIRIPSDEIDDEDIGAAFGVCM